jgi:uncharacterized protein (DUF302 family)
MNRLVGLALVLLLVGTAQAQKERQSLETPAFDKSIARQIVRMSIQRFAIATGVSMDDAIASMKLRANMLNFKMVADLPLSEQIKALGKESRRMQILAFCDAMIAKEMVEYDIIFAGFLPCRIAVIEDKNGKGWIVTTNMDMMLHAVDLPEHLQPLARKVRDSIYSIVQAGVNGDL